MRIDTGSYDGKQYWVLDYYISTGGYSYTYYSMETLKSEMYYIDYIFRRSSYVACFARHTGRVYGHLCVE